MKIVYAAVLVGILNGDLLCRKLANRLVYHRSRAPLPWREILRGQDIRHGTRLDRGG
jgi:hypothetical protein